MVLKSPEADRGSWLDLASGRHWNDLEGGRWGSGFAHPLPPEYTSPVAAAPLPYHQPLLPGPSLPALTGLRKQFPIRIP